MAQSGIVTGQYVHIQQATASIGDRILAQIIDWLVMLAYIAFSFWLLVEIDADGEVFFFFETLPILFYTLCMEVFNHGQSIGKMVMKTRVVKMDGSTPTLGAYIMRWLLYIIDGPSMSFLGVLVILLTKTISDWAIWQQAPWLSRFGTTERYK